MGVKRQSPEAASDHNHSFAAPGLSTLIEPPLKKLKFGSKEHRRPEYEIYEWPEGKNVNRILKKLMTKWIKPTKYSNIDFEKLISSPNPRVTPRDDGQINEQIQSISTHIAEDWIAVSNDGHRLAVYLQNGLERPWAKKKRNGRYQGKLIPRVTAAIQSLGEKIEPPKPNNDKRHRDKEKTKQKIDLHGKMNVGVYHFCLWTEQGKSDKPVMSNDIRPRVGYKAQELLEYYLKLAPLIQTIGILFQHVDPELYDEYRHNYNGWVNRSGLRQFHSSNRGCFLGHALLRNHQVAPHKDSADRKDGWVVMICFGEFEGGEMVVPGLDVKMKFQPGDVIFLRSVQFEHFVTDFKGNRSSMVFFTKDAVANGEKLWDAFDERLQ